MDLFAPGAGAAGQVHDYTPGVLPNGLFWTTAIHPDAFVVKKTYAKLRLRRLPLCDSFFFGNCEGVSSSVSTTVKWTATTDRKAYGNGKAAEPTAPDAFTGSFSHADCVARVKGRQTGFGFETVGHLDASGFFAEFGEQANGSML